VAIPASGGKSRKQEANNQPVRAEIELERSTNSFPNYSTLNTDLSATQINLLPTLHESHKALQNQHAASVSVGRAAIVAQQRPPERIDQMPKCHRSLARPLFVRLDIAGGVLSDRHVGWVPTKHWMPAMPKRREITRRSNSAVGAR
jgi:hypothetical protein